mmetsp:Transcript_1509/g.4531  ORF Transcript_1509/g.4531 Transcript_1509/m.4531 type:complete len:955 (+) Transcript_1509:178-3042(+)
MWYGASAPAPACWIHPLHKTRKEIDNRALSASGGKRTGSRGKEVKLHAWNPPCPSWAPLREPRLRREAELRKALSATRSHRGSIVLSGKFSPEEARRYALFMQRPNTTANDHALGPDGRTFLGARPATVDDPGNMMKVLSLPSLRRNSEIPSEQSTHRSKEHRHPTQGRRMSRRGSLLASRVPSNAFETTEGHFIGSRGASKGLPDANQKDKDKNDKNNLTGVASVAILSRRRNSLCDRLLDAKLNRMNFQARRTVLLEGGRRGSFLGPAVGVGTTKNLNQIAGLYAGDSRNIPKWDPDRKANAFRKVACSGVVTVGVQLAETLHLLGHAYPFFDILDRIIEEECFGRESLDLEDFIMVITDYESEVDDKLEAAFNEVAFGRDEITVDEVPDILREVGLPVMTGLVEELRAMTTEVDYEVFETIYEEVVQRAGLTAEEHKRLRLLFEELEGLDNTITAQELLGVLSWHESLTDLAGGVGVLQALIEETMEFIPAGRIYLDVKYWKKVAEAGATPKKGGFCDVKDSEVKVTSTAFIAAAAVLHSRITDGLRAALQKLGLDEKQVKSSSLVSIFEELGFEGAATSDVDSFLLACNLQGKSELSYVEFFTIIFRYCQADGVTEAESKDINDVFKRFDEDESGTLEAGEIGPVIRWLGYQPTQYRCWDFMEEIGLNFHSHIDALEFRRLTAKYKSLRLKEVRKVFLSKDRANDGYKISVGELEKLLNMVGYEPTREEILALVDQAGGRKKFIDFHEFKQLELMHRRWVQQTMARNGGFTDGELEKIHRHFMKADRNNTGYISGSLMRDIFFSLFPDKGEEPHIHSFIVMAMREADIDPNTFCDFDEFMSLMKHLQSEMDRDMLMQSLTLRQELGYTGSEIKQFRDLFTIADEDHNGSLDFEGLCNMFSHLMTLDMATKREIMALVMELGDEEGYLDFFSFLQIMHKVQSKKWRSMAGG